MNVSNFAAVLVVLLVFYVGTRYCIRLIRKQISPRIATWLIFEIGVIMSLASYLSGNDHSLIKAALNAADALQVTVILIAIVIEQKGRKIQFTRYELVSLLICLVATVAWLVTRTGWIGFIGFQSVMSIAYLPTVESLWRWKPGPSPEPMEKWGVNVIIALIGVAVDITGRHDYLAMVYPLRALILCVVVVVLITRWQQKNKANLKVILRRNPNDHTRARSDLGFGHHISGKGPIATTHAKGQTRRAKKHVTKTRKPAPVAPPTTKPT